MHVSTATVHMLMHVGLPGVEEAVGRKCMKTKNANFDKDAKWKRKEKRRWDLGQRLRKTSHSAIVNTIFG